MPEKEERFVVCMDNLDYPASLERYKIYQVIPDAEARAAGEIRIVDVKRRRLSLFQGALCLHPPARYSP